MPNTKIKLKIFKCARCGKYLGEMEKGRLEKGAVIFCKGCSNLSAQKADRIRNTDDIFSFLGFSRLGSLYDKGRFA